MFNLEDYETVEERLIKFWKDYPDGQIHTKILDSASGRFIVEAVYIVQRRTFVHGLQDLQRKRFKVEVSMRQARWRIVRLVLSVERLLTQDMQQRESERHEKKWSKLIKRMK